MGIIEEVLDIAREQFSEIQLTSGIGDFDVLNALENMDDVADIANHIYEEIKKFRKKCSFDEDGVQITPKSEKGTGPELVEDVLDNIDDEDGEITPKSEKGTRPELVEDVLEDIDNVATIIVFLLEIYKKQLPSHPIAIYAKKMAKENTELPTIKLTGPPKEPIKLLPLNNQDKYQANNGGP